MMPIKLSEEFMVPYPAWSTPFFKKEYYQWSDLTAAAHRALYLAGEIARHNADYIGPEQILLALLSEEGTGATRLIEAVNKSAQQMGDALNQEIMFAAARKHALCCELLLTPEAMRALAQAVFWTTGVGDVGTHSLLMGCLLSGESMARNVLWTAEGDIDRFIRAAERLSERDSDLFPPREVVYPANGIRKMFADIQTENVRYLQVGSIRVDSPVLIEEYLQALRMAYFMPGSTLCFRYLFEVFLKDQSQQPDKPLNIEFADDGLRDVGPHFQRLVQLVRASSISNDVN